MIRTLLYIKRHYGALLSEDHTMVHLTIYVQPVAAWDMFKNRCSTIIYFKNKYRNMHINRA